MAVGKGSEKKSPRRRETERAPDALARVGAKALIMSGYGINSEMESQEALARAGMGSDIVHIKVAPYVVPHPVPEIYSGRS